MAALLPITCWSLAHLDDAFHLGVLSSRIHVTYALAAGGWLGVGNDPVYSKTRCFDPFPFPLCGEAEKARIREIAEQLDAHRKRVQAQHSHLTLTGMYNVLEKLRAADAARYSPLPEGAEPLAGGAASLSECNHRTHAPDAMRPGGSASSPPPARAPSGAHPSGESLTGGSAPSLRDSAAPPANSSQASGLKSATTLTLTDKERRIHDDGLASVLKQLHDDLDAAVFAAYGWQHLWQAHLEAQVGTLTLFKTNELLDLHCGPEGPGPAIATWEHEVLHAEILERLVALNAQRADEEKRGIIHWLRPDYQRSKEQGGKSTEHGAGSMEELPLKPKKASKPKAGSKPTKQPWPKSLAERIRAVEQALHTTSPTTAEALSLSFARAKPTDVQEILESLVALGRARKEGERFSV